jgi:hypothetical protein
MFFLGSGICDLLERVLPAYGANRNSRHMHGRTLCGQTPLSSISAFSEFYLEQMAKEGAR